MSGRLDICQLRGNVGQREVVIWVVVAGCALSFENGATLSQMCESGSTILVQQLNAAEPAEQSGDQRRLQMLAPLQDLVYLGDRARIVALISPLVESAP